MSEPADGGGSGEPDPKPEIPRDSSAKVRSELDIPPTRKQDAIAEPPARPSQLDVAGRPHYPDDGPVSRTVRRIDGYIGVCEQIVLVGMLLVVILVAAGSALCDKLAGIHLEFKDDVIKGGTFAIALLGAAYASHQARHLSMDLISRRIDPRARLFLKVALGLFTVFIVVLLVRAGYHSVEILPPSEQLISPRRIAWMIPIGGTLVIVHALLHAVIDIDYIVRGKLPPERMRSAH